MTTAARPTFEPARGGSGKGETDLSSLSKQYSSRDLPGHTKLKYRQEGQGSSSDLKNRDFKRDLEDRERAARERRTERDYSIGASTSTASSSKRARVEPPSQSQLDADDPVDQDEDSEDSSSDEEDDTAELMAELARIKKERQQEAQEKEVERKREEERIRTENILKGNPLLNKKPAEFKVKRRWDDDVVFKNCAKMEDDKKKAEFINDTLRSEFHRKFMSKYIK